jgi:alpha-tubulin suppressor-like RCC1 family protein
VQAPNCDGTACDAGCNPFTLDCGQGYCACQNGQCTAVIFAEFLNADGPVATKVSSDPAVTSPELAAPTNLSALGSQGQINISWEDNSHVETGFEVHLSPTGAPNSFILLETVGINGTAFSNSGLTPDEHFCYRVRAVCEGTSTTTYSDFSNIACTTAAPVAIVSFEAVFAGGAHTCALTSAGAAYCWGRGESGQLGMPPPPSTCLTDGGFFSCSMVPVPVGGGLTFVKLAGGGAHTCALTSDGTAYCWGNNASGQLGDNSRTSRNAPVPVATWLKFDSIDAGAAHTCAVTSAGKAYCWGRNDRGQVGDGTTTNSAVPVAVTEGLTFQLIAAGGFSIGHTCGLTDLGAAYCWGENTFGALGDRSTKDSAVPVAVVGNLPRPESPADARLSFVQLVAGGFIGHTCGLIDGGAAYCWGENETGQVGDGTTIDRPAPEAVAGGLEFLTVDAGFRHTCGRAITGTVYCWGSNGAGQLGNNSNSLSTVPAKVFGQP